MNVDELPSYSIVAAATNHSELLDRAVWRRFQLRLSLPAPTEKQLIRYFERFFESISDTPGFAPATMVKRLGALSYAEAEEFTLDIRRREILAMKERPLKEIIERQLQLWKVRAQPSGVNQKEEASPNG
jgi:SpoVK/Ycf46/Vps4 family AAA+-type ATPase